VCVCVYEQYLHWYCDNRRRLRDCLTQYYYIIICPRTCHSREETFRCYYYYRYCSKSNSDKAPVLQELVYRVPLTVTTVVSAPRPHKGPVQHFMQHMPIIETFHAVCMSTADIASIIYFSNSLDTHHVHNTILLYIDPHDNGRYTVPYTWFKSI